MREAASNLEFEEAARLRDEVKRLKMLDLEFANDAMSGEGRPPTAQPRSANGPRRERRLRRGSGRLGAGGEAVGVSSVRCVVPTGR
jgi:excinuclease ABC subunit B